MRHFRKITGSALVAAVVLTAAGCDDFLTVRNPAVIEATAIDPQEDAPVFSRSAHQNFAVFYGSGNVYSGWFTTEAWVGDTFTQRNEIGARSIDFRNSSLNSDVWVLLSRSVATAEDALDLIGGAAGADQSVDVARAALVSGYSMIFMAEQFCRGTVRVGPELNTQQMLDMAVDRLNRAVAVGTAASTAQGPTHTATTRAEAAILANAARVGIARAQLQAGRLAEAIAAAQQVPAGFVYNVHYVDDPASRGRLGNGVFFYSAGGSRENVIVPPAYRAMNDPRVPFADAGRPAQLATQRLWTQRKYPGWGSPIRLASHLEARYIIAEAQLKQGNPAAALTLIGERRTAGNQTAFTGTGTDAILRELMDQRSRDFWLEGKRMGDFRRNPNSIPNMLQTGQPFYNPQYVERVGEDTCFPLPGVEIDRNPNIPA